MSEPLYRWTKTKPDRPGWWWMKIPERIQVVRVWREPGGLVHKRIDADWTALPDDAEWSPSPLKEPEPPEHELVQRVRRVVDILNDGSLGFVHSAVEELKRIAPEVQAALESK